MANIKFYIISHDNRIDEVLERLSDFHIEVVDTIMDCDFIFVIGGDGSVLHATKVAVMFKKPIIGYNMGTLGFLTFSKDINHILTSIVEKKYIIEKRALLRYSIDNMYTGNALNDIVLRNSDRDKMLNLNAVIKNTHETIQFQSDAVIISTPTGSTAYNLSAGGAIVHPYVKAMLITPVAPFSMSARPIIFPHNYEIEFSSQQPMCLTVDGITHHDILPSTTMINIYYNQTYNDSIQLVRSDDNFCKSIQDKLSWGNVIKK